MRRGEYVSLLSWFNQSSGTRKHGRCKDLLQDLGDLLGVHGNKGSPCWQRLLEPKTKDKKMRSGNKLQRRISVKRNEKTDRRLFAL